MFAKGAILTNNVTLTQTASFSLLFLKPFAIFIWILLFYIFFVIFLKFYDKVYFRVVCDTNKISDTQPHVNRPYVKWNRGDEALHTGYIYKLGPQRTHIPSHRKVEQISQSDLFRT